MSKFNITSLQDAIITSSNGTHISGKNNDDVQGFSMSGNSIVYYFPRGIEKIFKNLKGFILRSSELKEIHQSDLKVFPNLTYLELYSNDIQVIEEGLFDYNPELKVIWLSNNKITHVHPNVFDSLKNLVTLYFSPNTCINKYGLDAKNLKESIRQIKIQCPAPESTTTISAECPNSCSNIENQVTILNQKIEKFMVENSEVCKKIEVLGRYLNDSNIKAWKKFDNIDENFILFGQNMSQKIEDFQNKALPELVLPDIKNILNNLETSQNQKILEYSEKVEDVEERIARIFKQMEDYKFKLRDIQFKLLKSIDLKFEHVKEGIDKQIQSLEQKLHKIIKFLDISDGI